MSKHDHDPPKTSDSPRSGHGGRHSADPHPNDGHRTDAGRLLGPRDAPKEGGK